MTARSALKSATEEAHERLDTLIAQLNLADRADYIRFLQIHSAVLPPLEERLEEAGLEELVPGWGGHRRSEGLAADLAALGADPAPQFPLRSFDDPGSMLGAAYVLEGSRLGGQVLGEQVKSGFPRTFLGKRGNIAPWPTLIAALERHLYSEMALNQAKAAALLVFDAYFVSAGRNGLIANE